MRLLLLLLLLTAMADVVTCSSCSECGALIAKADCGDTIVLTTDLTYSPSNPGYACIYSNFTSDKDCGANPIVFDMDGHIITCSGSNCASSPAMKFVKSTYRVNGLRIIKGKVSGWQDGVRFQGYYFADVELDMETDVDRYSVYGDSLKFSTLRVTGSGGIYLDDGSYRIDIEDTNVHGSKGAEILGDSVSISNSYLSGDELGVYVDSESTGVNIEDSNIRGNEIGLATYGDYLTVSDTRISGPFSLFAKDMDSSDFYSVHLDGNILLGDGSNGNYFEDVSVDGNVWIEYSGWNEFVNVEVSGMFVAKHADGTDLSGVTVACSTANCIYLEDIDGLNVDATVHGATEDGLKIKYCVDADIEGQYYSNGWSGIAVKDSNDIRILSSTESHDNGRAGILVDSNTTVSHNISIQGTYYSNGGDGIRVADSVNVTVNASSYNNGGRGLLFYDVNTGSISGTFRDNGQGGGLYGDGISVKSSRDITITVEAYGNRDDGVFIKYSEVTVQDTYSHDNNGQGMHVYGGNVTVADSNFLNNGDVGVLDENTAVLSLRDVIIKGTPVGIVVEAPASLDVNRVWACSNTIDLNIHGTLTCTGTLHYSSSQGSFTCPLALGCETGISDVQGLQDYYFVGHTYDFNVRLTNNDPYDRDGNLILYVNGSPMDWEWASVPSESSAYFVLSWTPDQPGTDLNFVWGDVDILVYSTHSYEILATHDVDNDGNDEYFLDGDGDGNVDAYYDDGSVYDAYADDSLDDANTCSDSNEYYIDLDGDGTYETLYDPCTEEGGTYYGALMELGTAYTPALRPADFLFILLAGLSLWMLSAQRAD